MALSLKHGTLVDLGEHPDKPGYPVQPGDWNEEHDIVTDSTDPILLGATSTPGAVVDLTPNAVIGILSTELAPVTLSDTATVAVDWSAFYSATLTMGGNRTLGNPTGTVEPRSSRTIWVIGDSATERTLSFASEYFGPLPDETVTSTKALLLTLFAVDASTIVPTWKVVEL